jgi:putative glycosyltransferase (TIGR04348 family)
MKKKVVIVSPALADANNGNWQTARRWQKLLQAIWDVRIVRQWPDGPLALQDDCMLALHARRSAPSIAAWARVRSATDRAPGLAVVLTGTDLYRDIQTDAQAQQSLQFAQSLVVLQALGAQALPVALRDRVVVIFQGTSTRQTLPKTSADFRVVMVGHLREEKSPQTLFAAARLLDPADGILIDHIGEALTPDLGEQALATAQVCAHYRWLGGLTHEATRRRIQRAHVLVQTSRMEGGAHTVMEAVCCGTPVLASRIDGNVGMLGADYAGYFDWNDAEGLVSMLRRSRDSRIESLPTSFYAQLQAQCAERAHLFAPQAERSALRALVNQLIHTMPRTKSARAQPG